MKTINSIENYITKSRQGKIDFCPWDLIYSIYYLVKEGGQELEDSLDFPYYNDDESGHLEEHYRLNGEEFIKVRYWGDTADKNKIYKIAFCSGDRDVITVINSEYKKDVKKWIKRKY